MTPVVHFYANIPPLVPCTPISCTILHTCTLCATHTHKLHYLAHLQDILPPLPPPHTHALECTHTYKYSHPYSHPHTYNRTFDTHLDQPRRAHFSHQPARKLEDRYLSHTGDGEGEAHQCASCPKILQEHEEEALYGAWGVDEVQEEQMGGQRV